MTHALNYAINKMHSDGQLTTMSKHWYNGFDLTFSSQDHVPGDFERPFPVRPGPERTDTVVAGGAPVAGAPPDPRPEVLRKGRRRRPRKLFAVPRCSAALSGPRPAALTTGVVLAAGRPRPPRHVHGTIPGGRTGRRLERRFRLVNYKDGVAAGRPAKCSSTSTARSSTPAAAGDPVPWPGSSSRSTGRPHRR